MSAGAELKVVLIGGTESEQSVLSGGDPASAAVSATAAVPGDTGAVIDSMDKLSRHIDQLIERPAGPKAVQRDVATTPKAAARPKDNESVTSAVETLLRRYLPRQLLDFGDTVGRFFGRNATTSAAKQTEMVLASGANAASRAVTAEAATAGASRAAASEVVAGGASAGAAGPAILAAAAAAAILKIEFDALRGAVDRSTGAFREYSADIQTVDARTQMRRAETSVARAQEVGPQLANIQNSRDQLGEAMDRFMFALQKPLIQFLDKATPGIDALATGIEYGTENLEAIIALLNTFYTYLTGTEDERNKAFAGFVKELGDVVNFNFNKKKDEDFFGGPDELMRSIMQGDLNSTGGMRQVVPMPPNIGGKFP